MSDTKYNCADLKIKFKNPNFKWMVWNELRNKKK